MAVARVRGAGAATVVMVDQPDNAGSGKAIPKATSGKPMRRLVVGSAEWKAFLDEGESGMEIDILQEATSDAIEDEEEEEEEEEAKEESQEDYDDVEKKEVEVEVELQQSGSTNQIVLYISDIPVEQDKNIQFEVKQES